MESARCFCWTCSLAPNGTTGHVSRIFASKKGRSANSDRPPCSSNACRCLRPPQPPSHRTPWTWLGCRVGCQLRPRTARHSMASSPGQGVTNVCVCVCVCACVRVCACVCVCVHLCLHVYLYSVPCTALLLMKTTIGCHNV